MVNVIVAKQTVLRNSEGSKQQEAWVPSSISAWICFLRPPEPGSFTIRNWWGDAVYFNLAVKNFQFQFFHMQQYLQVVFTEAS